VVDGATVVRVVEEVVVVFGAAVVVVVSTIVLVVVATEGVEGADLSVLVQAVARVIATAMPRAIRLIRLLRTSGRSGGW
jgi:hypothetical protein